MLSDLLIKIEKLHEFIDDCVTGNSLSLIDKDIILQNLRDIYVDATRISLDDSEDDLDDDFEGENVILFDSNEPFKQIESAIDENNDEIKGNQEEILDEPKQQNNESEYSNNESEKEQIVYLSAGANDLDMSITDSERELIVRELCVTDENRYNELISRLSSFTDLDDVLIYISEEFPLNQNSESAILLADKMVDRLS